MAAKKRSANTGRGSKAKKKTTTAKKGNIRTGKASPARKTNPLAREITFLAILVFGILALLSIFHMCGVFGEVLNQLLFGLLGAPAYLFPVYLIVASGLYLSNPQKPELRRRVLFSTGLYWCLCGLFQWVVNDHPEDVFQIYTICSENQGGGGFFGGLLAYELAKLLGRGGAFIVILAMVVLFFMLISGRLFFASLYRLYSDRETEKDYIEYEEEEPFPEPAPAERKMNTYTFAKVEEDTPPEKKKKKSQEKKKKTAVMEEILPAAEEEPGDPAGAVLPDLNIIRGEDRATDKIPVYQEELDRKFGAEEFPAAVEEQPADVPAASEKASARQKNTKESKASGTDVREMEKVQSDLDQAAVREVPYRFPPLELLSSPSGGSRGMDNNELRATALKLQTTLESFGVHVKMGDISLGPSVTRYELIPEQGVKVSKITGLTDDIKLSLAASDIRIEAPIPGKAAVGIEVPNPHRATVTLRELLESSEFTKARSKVTFAVGKDISGKTIVTDIAKMPHLLIAGATGSGKSVLINTLIMSIIYKADPNEVKMIMVDPKMVELTAYEDIPHLMIPVVKDPKKASAALAWAVAEMTQRYQKFADTGVRDIKSYNARIDKATRQDDPEFQRMPQIVIIVDEFADLMMVAPGEVEDAVCRLAQLARAAGIHLVLATQRPSVNVITGLIKANIPSRIALSVSSQVDSRTIIDSAGADKLLGNGDMLFAPQNLPKPIRVQGAFVSDEERDGVVSFLKNSGGGPAYNPEVTKHIETAPVPGAKNGQDAAGGAPDQDELFVEAGMFIIEKDKASIGLLQRMFRIGFNRAARIMDQLSEAGVVGPEEGTKARQILMTREQFENYLEENG